MSTTTIEQAKLPFDWQWDARKKFLAYRNAVEKNPGSHVYKELMHAYHQLAMGRTVLSLSKAMQAAGSRANGEPVLAIANASAKWVWFRWDGGVRYPDSHGGDGYWVSSFSSDWTGSGLSAPHGWNRDTNRSVFRFPREYFALRPSRTVIRARVPIVPPDKLPKANLDNYAILWEANWQAAPKDPYLLRRITGDLFVVLAQWDLTEIERTVLEMSRVSEIGIRI